MEALQVFIYLSLLAAVCSAAKKTVCGPVDSLTAQLECQASEWIHVRGKRYSVAPSGSSCFVSIDCQKYLSSHSSGLQVNCNGPVGADGKCQETLEARKWLSDCPGLNGTAAVEVRYNCIPGANMMDMCTNQTRTWTPLIGSMVYAYLATPAFPNTPAISQHCSCTVGASDLWMEALQLDLDVGTTPPLLEVLTVSVNGSRRWSAAHSGQYQYLQEFLLTPDTGSKRTEAIVSYRDYNLPGQQAWIKIQGLGQNVTVSCEAVSVPPPPSTTTTTTTTTTPTPTTTTTTIKSTSTSARTSPQQTTSTAGAFATAQKPTSPRSGNTGRLGDRKPSNNENDDGVVVGLSVLAVVLIAAALVLAIIIWKRYQMAKKSGELSASNADGGRGFLAIQYWYSHYRNRQRNRAAQQRSPPATEMADFHDINADRKLGGNPGDSERLDVSYETMDDLNLALQQPPRAQHQQGNERKRQSGGSRTNTPVPGAGKTADEAGQVTSGEGTGSAGSFATNSESKSADDGKTGNARSQNPSPSPKPGSQTRKEKFVAKVLDQTLESIINQREELAATPPGGGDAESGPAPTSSSLSKSSPSPLPPPSPASLPTSGSLSRSGPSPLPPPHPASGRKSRSRSKDSRSSSKNSSSDESQGKQHRRERSSSKSKTVPKTDSPDKTLSKTDSTHKTAPRTDNTDKSQGPERVVAGDGDVYAVPMKSSTSASSRDRSGSNPNLNSDKADGLVWSENTSTV